MTVKDGDCEHCEHFVKDAYGQWVCEFDGECENMVREMTNEEWFCTLSTEEKVKALLNLHEKVRQKMKTDIGGENSFYKGDYYREWLKQPHTNE